MYKERRQCEILYLRYFFLIFLRIIQESKENMIYSRIYRLLMYGNATRIC